MVNTSLNKSLYIERKQIQRSHCELFCGLGKNVEVETDEKLPNRLTGPYRRQIHCPRLRKHKEYLKIFLQTTKKILGGILVNI